MSTRIMAVVWPLQMAPTAKAVLISLADQANDDGVCWPSVGTMCERTCLSERSVQGALGWLEHNGYLVREMKAGRATRYTLTPAAGAPPQDVHPRTTCTTTPAARAPAPAARAPRTVKNRHLNRKEETAGSFVLPTWIPADWWQRWEEHRQGIRKPLTDLARALQVERLEELRASGHEPADCIKAAISARWQAFYPPPPKALPATPSAAADRRAAFVASITGNRAGRPTDDRRTVDVDSIEPVATRLIAGRG